MAQTVLITLTIAGADTGPFDLYSDADAYAIPFETGVTKIDLEAGYLSVLVPDLATIIRVQSDSVLCTNFVDLDIVTTTTTTTTTTSTSTTTTTTTTTLPPDPPTANLTFTSYLGGLFTFDLSSAIYSTNTVISDATVDGHDLGACAGPINETDNLSGNITITAGNTTGSVTGNTPMSCVTLSFTRGTSIIVNGLSKTNGQTITIGGTTVTVIISGSCVDPYAC